MVFFFWTALMLYFMNMLLPLIWHLFLNCKKWFSSAPLHCFLYSLFLYLFWTVEAECFGLTFILAYILVTSEKVIKCLISWWYRHLVFKNEATTNYCKVSFYESNLSAGRVIWLTTFYWRTSNFQFLYNFSLGLLNFS